MLAKINSVRAAVFILALAAFISGCTPAGPRALLQGKKNLDAGDYAAAVEQLKTATTLLATNANAWNYYGVALQRAGQATNAAEAYQTALKLDRDLVEAHFNLGSLCLEQNKPDAAKAEFTAFTLRRPNAAPGWLKLGSAQLKLGEIVPAERSFSSVLALKQNNEAEAYHGLGLARIQRGKPRDAALFFAAAVQARPDFAPALLDLAIVNHQYLHDNRAALENYHAYLTLTPRPANWDEVNALAISLEQMQVAAATPPPAAKPAAPAPAPEPKPQPKIATAATPHASVTPKPEPEVKTAHITPRPAVAANPVPAQVVQVPPAPPIVTTPPAKVAATAPANPLEVPLPEPAPKKSGFWHKLFGSDKNTSAARQQYLETGLTPLPASDEPAPHAVARPADETPAPASSTRYNYLSPRKPAAGDRTAASGAFTKAQVFEQGEKWIDAEQWYQQAAEFDPAWFEAQFNTGVLAHRLRNYPLALPRYELALAIRPDSVDARYNFALALKAAGHAADAADEFRKILAANPGEVRAHLALANLCAQTLHDAAQARQHYLKVLDLDPKHPQASDIRFWLSANPG